MEIQVEINGTQALLTLPSDSDLTVAGNLREHLLAQIDNRRAIAIDAHAVERLTTPCVQIMVAASLSAQSAQMPYVLANPSAQTRAAFADLGLQSMMESWLKSPSEA